jgi:hypothetical protein
MKVLDFTGCCQEEINYVTEYINDNNIECKSTDDDTQNLVISDSDAEKIENDPKFEWYDFQII